MVDLDRALLLADLCLDLGDERNDLLDLLMCKKNRAEHLCLGDFLCARFDHHDRVLRSCNGQAETALLALCERRVQDVFTVDHADCHGTRRSHERRIGDGQRNGRTDHAEDLGLDVLLDGEDGRDDLDVIVKSLREQRANGAIDEAGSQDGLLARTTLAFDEAAGDLAHGVELLFEFDAEREKIHAVACGLCYGRAHEHRGVSAAHEAGTAGLFCILAGFDGQCAAAELHFKCSCLHVACSFCYLSSFFIKTCSKRAAKPVKHTKKEWREKPRRFFYFLRFRLATIAL